MSWPQVSDALASASPSSLIGVTVEAERGTIRLKGTTANEHQRVRAGLVASTAAPGWTIENSVTPREEPPLVVLTEARIRELAAALNEMDGVYIDASWHDEILSVVGIAPDSSIAAGIARTFDNVPGVRTLECNVEVGASWAATRLYFELNSAIIRPSEFSKLDAIVETLIRMPHLALEIIGHSDQAGNNEVNQRISQARARAVRDTLIQIGIPGVALRPWHPRSSAGKYFRSVR